VVTDTGADGGFKSVNLEPVVTSNDFGCRNVFGNDSPKMSFSSEYAQHCHTVKNTLKLLKLDFQDLKTRSWFEIHSKCIESELGFYKTFQLHNFYLTYQCDLLCTKIVTKLPVTDMPENSMLDNHTNSVETVFHDADSNHEDPDKIVVLEMDILKIENTVPDVANVPPDKEPVLGIENQFFEVSL
jgi:hypothetical protein